MRFGRLAGFLFAGLITAGAACGGASAAKAPPSVPVTVETARQTALARVPGTIQEEELDEENGRWVWDFDIKPTDQAQPVQEVHVDANTGEVLLVEND